jgi:hypothetical protein
MAGDLRKSRSITRQTLLALAIGGSIATIAAPQGDNDAAREDSSVR